MQAYPGGQSAFTLQSLFESQKSSSQQKQLPSTSWLQYAALKGPQPEPHWYSVPPQVQAQSPFSGPGVEHWTQAASALEPRLVTIGASQAAAVPTPRRLISRLRDISLPVLSSSILHPLPVG
jgi:hypothetical protein